MTHAEVVAVLMGLLRITRVLGEAIRQITEQQTEIIALRWMLEARGVATTEELDEARAAALRRLKELNQLAASQGSVKLLTTLNEGEQWKM